MTKHVSQHIISVPARDERHSRKKKCNEIWKFLKVFIFFFLVFFAQHSLSCCCESTHQANENGIPFWIFILFLFLVSQLGCLDFQFLFPKFLRQLLHFIHLNLHKFRQNCSKLAHNFSLFSLTRYFLFARYWQTQTRTAIDNNRKATKTFN